MQQTRTTGMSRRTALTGIATSTVALTTGLAGCSSGGSSGPSGLQSSVEGPYLWPDSAGNWVYARAEFRGSPQEYPTEEVVAGGEVAGFDVGIQTDDGPIETGVFVEYYEDQGLSQRTGGPIEKSYFEYYDPAVVPYLLDSNEDISSGTTFTLYLVDPGVSGTPGESGRIQVGEVTYEGSPEEKDPEPGSMVTPN
jgi:hypothetical protein